VTVLAEQYRRPLGRAEIGHGDVSVVEKVVGYKKVKFHTHENVGYGDVRLPDIEMHTTSFWLTVPGAVSAELGRAATIEGLTGLGHALELCATLALMCDPRDLGRALEDASPAADHAGLFTATLYLFDNVPGGVGLSERIGEEAATLLERSAALLAACGCPVGCPGCVGATAAGTPGSPPPAAIDRKRAALALARALGFAGEAPRGR
jgi:DEAD/DEAH box helicase domain-containing protein